MKHLKKAAVLLIMILMIFSNTAAVHAEDEETTAESRTYTAHYRFVLKDSEESLPEEVMALLPEDRTDLQDGTLVSVEKIEDVAVNGVTYSFLGWDKSETVIEGSDVTFTGTWGKDIVKIPEEVNPEGETPEKEEEKSSKTYRVEFSFIKLGSFSGEGLPEEVMVLLPESQDVEEGNEPELPEYGITARYQFKGWDKAQWTNDEGELHTLYVGTWDKMRFMVIPGGYPGPEGAVKVSTGSPIGVPGSGVPSFSINGHDAYCVTPNITGYPVSGTSYYPAGMYGDASDMSERVANVILTGESRGASKATIQAAVWDALGYNYGVSWEDYYDSGIEAWGEVYETYHDPNNGKPMQDIGYPTGSRPLGGWVKVYKRAASTAFNYVSNCPNNYSLAGAVYGVYSDSGCNNRVDTLTTGSDGESGKSDVLDEGTYYIKEISPSPGFLNDPNIYPVSVSAGETSSITSSEQPINDPFYVELFKKDRRESKYVNHLDEAEFTLRYYDAQTDSPSGSPKFTWVFRTIYDSEGRSLVKFDREHYVRGDSINELTNSAGLFFLPLGTFTIEETLAPQLYAKDENIYVGRVRNVSGHAEASIEGKGWVEVENLDMSQSEELQTVSLVIQKVNDETGTNKLPTDHIASTATLQGGIFHIWRIGEYDTDKENPKIIDIAPIDYGTITTDETGKAELKYERVNGEDTTEGLLPGKFRIKEEKAPNGFAVNTAEFILDAPVRERNTATFQYSLDIGDKLTRIEVEKLDQNGELLSGEATATIQVIETETGKVVYEFIADGQPHLIRGLTTLFNYHLHELYVAPNYKLAIDKDINPIDEDDSELHTSDDADHQYSNYYHMIDHEVEIHTTATFDNKGKKEWDNQSNKHYVADGVAHIYDEVAYKNVYEGETYILVGELWDKTDNVSLDNTVRKEFVPAYDVGTITLEFDQQLDDLDNHELVVFETLYRKVRHDDESEEEIKIIEHKDLEDEDQTVYVDELYRRDFEIIKVNADDEEEVLEGVAFNIKTYRIKRDGTVEDYDLGNFTSDSEGKISIEKLKEDCKITVTELEEKDPTWYRWEEAFIYDIGHDSAITEALSEKILNHKIKIGTRAKFEESGEQNYVADGVAHIIDTVDYEWLYEGDQYRLVTILIDKGTKEEPKQEEVTKVEHEFTAKGLNGSEDVSIEFDFTDYENHDFVVFEELIHVITEDVPRTDEEGKPVTDEEGNPVIDKVPTGEEHSVAEHKDIEDEGQTVHCNELYRALMVMYKTDASKTIRLNGAVFTITTRRVRRDGTVKTADLGHFVTGGIFYEQDSPFRFLIARDKEMSDVVTALTSAVHPKFSRQYIQTTELEPGIYYGQVEGEEEVREYYVAKGMIYLPDMVEDTDIIYHEEIAPEGYYLPGDDFIANVGHDQTITRIENERPNQRIVRRTTREEKPSVPKTGRDQGLIQ